MGDQYLPETDIVLHENLEYWMTRLPAPLKSIPINQLAIPGSHDTMTFTIKRQNDVSPDESPLIQFLGRHFSLISKPIIYNWSITQSRNLQEQLNGGIRYLDIRLACKSHWEVFFVHGLYGSEITESLNAIDDWLGQHPHEVVILDLQHFYCFNETDHHNLINKLKNVFQRKLCPVYPKFDHVTLNWLNSEKYQVFLVYRNQAVANERFFWPSGFWPTPWPDTCSPDDLVHFLNVKLQSRSPETAFVSQCLLTPDVGYVCRHFCGSLKGDLAESCRRVMFPWILENLPGPKGLNIVIADFVGHDNFLFSKTVIQRNALYLTRYS